MNHQPQQYVKFAQEIYLACKGMGTDEQRILNVILQCTMEDLYQVNRAFYASYGKSITRLLEKETSGNFENILTGCFEGRYQYWARKIREAVKGAGTDEKALIELVIMGDTQDWEVLKTEYFKQFARNIVDDIQDDIAKNADWARLLRGWIFQMRYPRGQPERDADELYKAAKGAGTDEDTFIRLFCTTIPQEFAQICQIYAQKYKKTLRETVIKEFSGKSEKAFLLAHDFLLSPTKGCCWIIKDAIKGMGTRDRSLVNVTVLFRDRYAQGISQAYTEYGNNLAKDIKGDTSGWYEKTLLQLWRAQ
ncbi:Annexin_1 [Hexamita inflata]|uniref:Annexin_1 n=1 Tax=Hexamita inflata TaxID=28002 RepID=A0ABP1HC64_9EUKA